MSASSFYPTINTPTRTSKATSKTLIDNISYNDFTKEISRWNILTSISNHLTEYLSISNQTEVSLNNSKTKLQKLEKLIRNIFWSDLEIWTGIAT